MLHQQPGDAHAGFFGQGAKGRNAVGGIEDWQQSRLKDEGSGGLGQTSDVGSPWVLLTTIA